MSVNHSNRRGMYYGVGREIPGVILGLVLLAIALATSWYLSYSGLYYLGYGGIYLGITGGAWVGYLYSALNRKRKFDVAVLLVVVAYAAFAYGAEMVLAIGQEIVNFMFGSSIGFLVEIFAVLLDLFLVVATFSYAKRTDLR